MPSRNGEIKECDFAVRPTLEGDRDDVVPLFERREMRMFRSFVYTPPDVLTITHRSIRNHIRMRTNKLTF